MASFFATIGLNKEKEYFLESLSMLVESGMDIYSAIQSIRSDIHNKRMKNILYKMEDDLLNGITLHATLKKYELFPENIIALIRIGEESGQLSENLKIISIQQQKNKLFYSKIKSASMYPIFVLVVTLIIGLGIAWFVLPKLGSVFAQMKVELPPLTRGLIFIGDFLSQYGAIFIPSLILFLALFIYFLFIFPKTKHLREAILFKFPGVKSLITTVEMARFTYIFGILLKTGIPILDIFESLYESAPFKMYKQFYAYLKENVRNGNSIKNSFESYKNINNIIPTSIQQMIISGEQSGHLSEVLLRIATLNEEKIEISSKNLSVMLEPLLLIIIWVFVGLLAFSVITPIYSLLTDVTNPPSSPPTSQTAVPTPPSKEEKAPKPEQIEEVIEETKEPSETIEATQPTTPEAALPQIEILPTGVGYLNVRTEPNVNSRLIKQITPGDIYPYKNEQDGWYEIVFPDLLTGWISSEYAKKLP